MISKSKSVLSSSAELPFTSSSIYTAPSPSHSSSGSSFASSSYTPKENSVASSTYTPKENSFASSTYTPKENSVASSTFTPRENSFSSSTYTPGSSQSFSELPSTKKRFTIGTMRTKEEEEAESTQPPPNLDQPKQRSARIMGKPLSGYSSIKSESTLDTITKRKSKKESITSLPFVPVKN